ncbi:MAG: hypothetical protein JWP26_2980 [Devosia sp.]|uniref:TMEM43 family protein n=1 Tax=Devosia sp. TaxID=1871048 RepID=UPI00262F8842|nr:TMEM43 family protein [Devosia sp.]MDB5588010.1 hypothetical protein [Devosia sp.]
MSRRVSSKIDFWLLGILRSFIGVAVGIALIVGMVALLSWNEIGVLQAERALALGTAPIPSNPDSLVWTIRPIAMIGLMAGFMLLGGPLAAIANLSSGFGAMVRFGTAIFATALGLGLGTLTIAVVWMFYRPWLSIIVVLVGAVVSIGIVCLGVRIADIRYKSDPLPPPDAEPPAV